MAQFKVVGGYTVVHYRTKTFEAASYEEAVEKANAELEDDPMCYLEWDERDVKENDDFEIVYYD